MNHVAGIVGSTVVNFSTNPIEWAQSQRRGDAEIFRAAIGGANLKLFLLTALTMLAFASNSILNRMALVDGTTGPAAFAAVRLLSGAFVLALLAQMRNGLPLTAPGRWIGVGSLGIYMLGFSLAYVSLDAGIGALILFGGVQVTMFAGAIVMGARVPVLRWVGAAIAMSGLIILCWPGGDVAAHPAGIILMIVAAVGWGVYSLHGRGATDPLGQTAANFVWTAPLGILAFLAAPAALSPRGLVLGCVCGIVTSGLGYALWYSVLPRLQATMAAVAQLTVPVIATAGGILFLGEVVTWRFAVAALLVLGGILVSVISARRR